MCKRILKSNQKIVVIAGAGAAGIATALAVANDRQTKVILLETSEKVGGTVSQALIHTLGGLYDDKGQYINKGLPVSLEKRLIKASTTTRKRKMGKIWVLNIDPEVYEAVIKKWLKSYSNIEILFKSSIIKSDIILSSFKQKISTLHIKNKQKIIKLQADVVVDTTGDAAVVRQINPSLVSNGAALAGLIIQLRGVNPKALNFPRSVALLHRIRKATKDKILPKECATLWLDSGHYADEIYVKFSIQQDKYEIERMNQVILILLSYLKTITEFREGYIYKIGQLGIRDGGQVQGEYCLTEEDIRTGRKFNDSACIASWPIEYWNPKKGVCLEYFPVGHTYSIPQRTLKVAGFKNLWVAGKCLSAEPRVQASARVVGTCWAMGEAVGKQIIKGFY